MQVYWSSIILVPYTRIKARQCSGTYVHEIGTLGNLATQGNFAKLTTPGRLATKQPPGHIGQYELQNVHLADNCKHLTIWALGLRAHRERWTV
jgi:hypothetical protein